MVLTAREQKRITKPASHCLKSKQFSLPQQNRQKLHSVIEKLFSKNSPKQRMNFDKTCPKNRNPQQQNISRNPTKKTAQL